MANSGQKRQTAVQHQQRRLPGSAWPPSGCNRGKKNHIVFHHDNARPHLERRVVNFIANKGWDLLPHPPYLPTEAPMDYHVYRSVKNWQMNKI
ncbi:hypothetical protein TNCT_307911 [Trichonephila clavata]|uniref:Histone-lysine N-methyltransferase SETMAR n=1 Tax=Trichonephila clavata TaxID=2740835 RepID=A0A8X6K7Q4_TRICU|nr:hypothetical protein TNCT_307911 [Trichonephila clavata]